MNDVITQNDTIKETDLVNRKILDNDFYGFTFSSNYADHRMLKLTLGGGWNNYYGQHFGKIIWADFASNGNNDRNWYYSTGKKSDFNVFAKASFMVLKKVSVYGDIQYRNVDYHIDGQRDDMADLTQYHHFGFFNPKTGVLIDFSNHHHAYASIGMAHREPSRSNYNDADINHQPKPEELIDVEAGYRLNLSKMTLLADLYYMHYYDQLILTGEINDVGASIMTNIPKSYRIGLEISAAWKIIPRLSWEVNATLARNRVQDFTEYVDQYDAGWNFLGQVSKKLGETPISFSPAFIGNSIINYEIVTNLDLGFQSKYVSRQYIDNTGNHNRSLDPYFVNNLLISYSIHPKFMHEIRFTFALNNMLNEKYESNAWVYRYRIEGNEMVSDGYFPQAGINFLAGICLGL